ncbi:MAG: DinB family protein [Planctomycetota bacterium]
MTTTSIIRQLTASMNDTLSAFKLSERDLKRTYRKGGWTIREVLIHIADCETVFVDRVRRIIAEERPLLMPFDENSWITNFGGKNRDFVTTAMLFEVNRMTLIETLSVSYTKHQKRVGVHAAMGLVTLHDQVTKVITHTEHHNAQISKALRSR